MLCYFTHYTSSLYICIPLTVLISNSWFRAQLASLTHLWLIEWSLSHAVVVLLALAAMFELLQSASQKLLAKEAPLAMRYNSIVSRLRGYVQARM